MTTRDLPTVFSVLKKEVALWQDPIVTQCAKKRGDPFKILVSTLISLRTKDAVTGTATDTLWKLAGTPGKMQALPTQKIAKAIYPAGFYKTKAKRIKAISRLLVDKYNGKVPDEIDKLIKLKGIGRKTANLVVTKAYGKLGICVDTHVHRIVNRWGYIRTNTPDKTEAELRIKLPLRYWLIINDILVSYGQNTCTPVSPYCSQCKIKKFCARKAVGKAR